MTSNRNDSVIGKSSSLLKKPSKISSRNEEKKPNIFRRIQNMVAGLFSVCMSGQSKSGFEMTQNMRSARQSKFRKSCNIEPSEEFTYVSSMLAEERRKARRSQVKAISAEILIPEEPRRESSLQRITGKKERRIPKTEGSDIDLVAYTSKYEDSILAGIKLKPKPHKRPNNNNNNNNTNNNNKKN
ncbi:kinesin-related protein 12-like isoform X2 [Cimex lectularius]|uniref:Uncharacterized protein n=1 Tax=Cimex lectularius TaxID=79782 RepID=A0A8I6S1Q6_CIMLE|nr:kinesin-related protein 12-like isoform X2 [Cimex lectularius]XP_014251799.1 kinesin-related protein 12-like isoform X2 [Cimex lectularius]